MSWLTKNPLKKRPNFDLYLKNLKPGSIKVRTRKVTEIFTKDQIELIKLLIREELCRK